MFVRRDGQKIHLLVAKVTDDFLVSRERGDILDFMEELNPWFKIGEIFIGGEFSIIGCMIKVGVVYTRLDLNGYEDRILLLPMTIGRKKLR